MAPNVSVAGQPVTVSVKVTPPAGDILVATAEERSLRGRSGIYDVTVRRDDPAGQVIAEFRGRSRALG